jgi:hypothetical protein
MGFLGGFMDSSVGSSSLILVSSVIILDSSLIILVSSVLILVSLVLKLFPAWFNDFGGITGFLGGYMMSTVVILVISLGFHRWLHWFPRFKNVSSVFIWATIKVVKTNEKTMSQLNNNLQFTELTQVSVDVCGRQSAADYRIFVMIPAHKSSISSRLVQTTLAALENNSRFNRSCLAYNGILGLMGLVGLITSCCKLLGARPLK